MYLEDSCYAFKTALWGGFFYTCHSSIIMCKYFYDVWSDVSQTDGTTNSRAIPHMKGECILDWKPRDSYTSIADIVTKRSGLSEDELLHPKSTSPTEIENLQNAAKRIKKAVKNGEHISVMGDYDVDGITSTAILHFTLTKLGSSPFLRLPKRFSEGYGLNVAVIDEFESGLLITVDNGIAANDAVKAAKEKGLDVIVLDHHLPQEQLPCADIIVDPHVSPEKNGFVDYCGAGIAYKLAQLLIKDDAFLKEMEVLAAIGTIADSVPLVGDNRVIVKGGLKSMKNGDNLVPGLKALFQMAEVYDINETDIGFKIGPMLNAAGRLKDDGAALSLNTIIAKTESESSELAFELKTLNDQRKNMTASTEAIIEEIIRDDCLYFDKPMCILAEGIPEGIVGILTGRIAEKYKTPTFILTNTGTPGVYKGSGRSYGDYNLMDAVNAAMPFLLAGGGHAGAAGISVNTDNYANMVDAMREAMASYEAPEVTTLEYDMEINTSQIAETYLEVEKFAPFGQGNPRPVFCVTDIMLSPRGGSTAKYMGKTMEHVKLLARNFSVICFGASEEYRRMGCPINIDAIGELSKNVFRYNSELQIEAIEFREHKKPATGKPSSLLDALRRNGTI